MVASLTDNITLYPGFGEGVKKNHSNKTHKTAIKAIALVGASFGLVLAGSLVIAFTAAPPVAGALLITAGVILGVVLAVGLIRQHKDTIKWRRFPNEAIEENLMNAPRPGAMHKADVIVSNGVEKSVEMKKQMIRSATKSIEWSFNYAGGAPFQEMMDLIELQMEKNPELTTHLLLSDALLSPNDQERLEAEKRKFGDRFSFVVASEQLSTKKGVLHSEANHMKLLVVDEKYFAIGGSGLNTRLNTEDPEKAPPVGKNEPIGNHILDRASRDTDIFGMVQEGDLLGHSMRVQFFNLFQVLAWRMDKPHNDKEGRYFPVIADSPSPFLPEEKIHLGVDLKFVVSAPEMRKNPIESEMITQLKTAKKTVHLASLFFDPSARMRKAFSDCLRKNVKINAVLNGDEGNLIHLFYKATAMKNYPLVSVVNEYRSDIMLHKKVMVIDDQISECGSFNFSIKSSKHDYEAVVFIFSKGVAEDLMNGFDEDIKASKQVENKAGVGAKIAHRFAKFAYAHHYA